MRRLTYIYACIAMLLAACTDDNKEHNSELYLSFIPAVQANTRAEAGVYPVDVPFGVWGIENGSSLLLDDAIVLYENGSWQPETPCLWKSNSTLTFYAYSPYTLDFTYSAERGVQLECFDVLSGVEPLFTHPVVNCDRRSGGVVPLTFMSTLARVEFYVRSMEMSDSVIVLKSLSVDGMAYEGSFSSLPTPEWTTTDKQISLQFCNKSIEVGTGSQYLGSHIVLPQYPSVAVCAVIDIYDKEGNLLCADKKILSEPIIGRWSVSKFYSYTLDVTTSGITFATDFIEDI